MWTLNTKEKMIFMAARNARTKTTAKMTAKRLRAKGFNTSVFKKKKGYGVSVTR